jgi:hypothetical protein
MDRKELFVRAATDLAAKLRVSANAIPNALRELLGKALVRRNTGLMLLGGRPEARERTLLLAEALVATQAVGAPALVLPWHRLESPVAHLEEDEVNTQARSRRLPNLPVFHTFEGAYAAGHRRIVVEHDSHPYPPVPVGFIRDHAHELCVIACLDDLDATDAFTRAMNDGATHRPPLSRADRPMRWHDLQNLIGVLTWVRAEAEQGPLSICDAFVPGDTALNGSRYETPSAAVHSGRQLRWETQLIELLDEGAVAPNRLQSCLSAWGLLESEDIEAFGQPVRPEALRVWIWEKLLARDQAPNRSFARYHD